MSVDDIEAVTAYRPLIEDHIRHLVQRRIESNSDAPVVESECAALLQEVKNIRHSADPEESNSAQWPPVETVCRESFVNLIAAVDIFDASFLPVWILLDVITILSDADLCEPALALWLIEELLDSQTINGCRKVFTYLESRRERIIMKHFKHKNLVILRCCNELLRRLSRAEDTVFCGRVFIYMFQSFPLGDKSSVNLRGEFHVENVTAFDPAPKKSEGAIKPMEIDSDGAQLASSGAHTPASTLPDTDLPHKTGRSTPAHRSVKGEPKVESPPDLDALYPKFWTLQSLFSAPTRLFEPAAMATFKDGIAATMACFKSVSSSSSASSAGTEIPRGIKRKRSDLETSNSTASTFNPKYLTNRDLFDLEVHDTAFRRHIVVQALILLDFLLSLTPAARLKFDGLTNKSVLYPYTLSDDDAKWATSTRSTIAAYLQQGNGNEGKFYYRMVDTVLSRDKNWVRWKAENCPGISRPAVDVETYVEAQHALGKICEKGPLPTPPGASDLKFLSKKEPLERLKRPSERMVVPSVEEYWKGIEGDELDLEMAADEEEKKEIEERKAGRVWRALRASGRRFVLCEKIKDGANLKALVGDDEAEEVPRKEGTEGDGADTRKDEAEEEEDQDNEAERKPEKDATDAEEGHADNTKTAYDENGKAEDADMTDVGSRPDEAPVDQETVSNEAESDHHDEAEDGGN